MTLSDTLASWREALPTVLRCLAITLGVALVGTLAVGSSWLVHRPVGYSGDAHTSSLISPGFASGFDVAWELTGEDLGVGGPLRTYEIVDGYLVALFGEKDQPPTLVGLDLSGEKPSVLWRREVPDVDSPMFAWGDSVVVAGQTIRVADGEITATWATPIPTHISSYFDSFNKNAFIYVGGDEVKPADGGFLRVTSPVIVICYPRDKSDAVQDFDYLCLGWNKDGTEAWRYKVTLSPFDLQGPGLPLPVRPVDGYVPVSRNFTYADRPIGAFLHLADGTIVESATYATATEALRPVADGWVLEGTMPDDPQKAALVTLAPDGTEISRTRLADLLMSPSDLYYLKCWNAEGGVVRPTREQMTSTLTSGEATWAHLCTNHDRDTGFSGVTNINGRRLKVTNEAGGSQYGSYPDSMIPATDGSLMLSQPPKAEDSTDKNPPMNLYAAPSGIQLASLEDVGVRYAQPFYDDLLIAKPNHPDSSWHRYLGTYPHPDTVLMGITPKRAG